MMKKLLYVLGGLVVLLLVAALLVPVLFKDKIVVLVKEEINDNLNAKVDFSSFGMSFFRHFPSLTCSLHDLSVVGTGDFEGDTLAYMKSLDVGVNVWSLISGSGIRIRHIGIDEPRIHVLVLEDGRANYDIAKPDSVSPEGGEPSSFRLTLQGYAVRGGLLRYDDRSLGFAMRLDGLDHEGSGDFTQDLFVLSTRTRVAGADLWYGGIRYLHDAVVALNADLDMNMADMRFTFKKNTVALNELAFGLDGWLAMPDDENIEMDLAVNAAENEFRNFLSLVPGVYSDQFADVKASGTLALDAHVKGTYNEKQVPGFGLTVRVQNGNFRYPALPAGVNNVDIDLQAGNPDGDPDHTVLNLSRFHAEFGKEPLDARLVVKTPVSDPDIDVTVKGRLDLSALAGMVPMTEGTSLAGLFQADLFARGKTGAAERKQFDAFEAGGRFALTGFSYRSPDFPDGISISDCRLSLNPKNATLEAFDFRSGATDLHATGTLENLAGYAFAGGMLKGFAAIRSDQIDLNPYMTDGAAAETGGGDSTQTGVLEVPENVDFVLTADVGKVLYEELVLTGVHGNLAVRDRVLGMNDVGFGLLDGRITLNGLYNTKDPQHPQIHFDLSVAGMDVRKSFDHFNPVQKLAPIAGMCTGRFSSTFGITGQLDEHMDPVYASLAGGGRLQTHGVQVSNFAPLVKVADALKMDRLRKAELSDANLSFRITEGRVYIEPFDQRIAGIDTRVEGSSGLDQTIDYTWSMKLPMKAMPSAATAMVSGLLAKANAAGANLSMGETVNVRVTIGGTVNDPVIRTDLGGMAGSAAAGLKEQAREALESKKKELEDRARATADSLKRDAEAKAKAESDRLRKEAEEKAKAEAERLKKEAEEKAKKEVGKQLKDLFGKPK